MKYRIVTAIVHANSLEAVEDALRHAGAIEVAITHVKGYGDYKNFYSPEWISEQARVEVFIAQAQAQGGSRGHLPGCLQGPGQRRYCRGVAGGVAGAYQGLRAARKAMSDVIVPPVVGLAPLFPGPCLSWKPRPEGRHHPRQTFRMMW